MPGANSLAITQVTASIAQYGDHVKLSDRLIEAGIDKVVTEATALLGEQAGDTLDQVTRDILVAGTGVAYASTATSRGGVGSGMTLSSTDLLKAVRTLRANNAKTVDGTNYIMIIHPKKKWGVERKLSMENLEYRRKPEMATPRHRMALVA